MPQKGQKKIPVRRCVGCGEGRPKKELVRVVRASDGAVSLDLTGRKAGRGAYLCRSAACLQKAQKRRGLNRAFSCEVPAEVYAALGAELAASCGPEAADSAGTPAKPAAPSKSAAPPKPKTPGGGRGGVP